jgi:peptidyl-tRNA hydrolase
VERHEDERVQPIVLLVDKADPAAELDAIRAVAVASVSMYARDHDDDDDDDGAGTAWREWLAGPFAKSVRRADRKTFERIVGEATPSESTITKFGRAEAIAFRPMIAMALPKSLSRLQVAGTQLPASATEGGASDGPVVYLNSELEMSTGKAAAQAAHALFQWFLNTDSAIAAHDIDCDVQLIAGARFAEMLSGLAPNSFITDAGRTEIEPGSVTAFAQ